MRNISKTRLALLAVTVCAGLPVTGNARQQLQTQDLSEPVSIYQGELVKIRGGERLVSVVVKLEDDSLATYEGGLPGLAATSPKITGARRLNTRSTAARAYLRHLRDRQDAFVTATASVRRARVVHRFSHVFGGVSMTLPESEIPRVVQLPGVKAVYRDRLLPLETDRSPAIIGAPALWNQVGGQANAGRGVIVGVVDTGIWPEHPSLNPSGFPTPPADWAGTRCELGSDPVPATAPTPPPGQTPGSCNNKLLGAARFMDTFDNFGANPLPGEFYSARDNNGHGSHVATTAVGNASVGAGFGGDTSLALVSGIAPAAHLAVYKACFTNAAGQGSCFTSDSAAAVEQAVQDGVDVLNFSVGGGTDPYNDVVSLAFLDAYEAGVFVAAAAGNSGPGADTVGHRGPWMTTVAASTTDRNFEGSASLTGSAGSLTLTGVSVMGPLNPAVPVVNSSDPPYGDDMCLAPAPAGSLTGKMVICRRGVNARIDKGANVKAGGAVAMILRNNNDGETLNADIHWLPTVHINGTRGAALVAFMAANTGEMGTQSGGAPVLNGQADVIAGFSSRGGSGQTLGVSKPDLGAPGVNILAANTPAPAVPFGPNELFQIINGTSMASPHVAGAAAVIKQLHPTWTPGQIKSALMTTATVDGLVKENGITPADPFDVGSGRIDLAVAGSPGVTFDATKADYLAHQSNLSVANYPSLYLPALSGRVLVPRTIKDVTGKTRDWRLRVESSPDLAVETPNTVRVPKNREKTFYMIVDGRNIPQGQTRHATLFLENSAGTSLRFPITAVRRDTDITIVKICDPLVFPKGASTNCSVSVSNNSFDNANALVVDQLPSQLKVSNVSGAFSLLNTVFWAGSLAGATPPGVTVDPGTTPAGYLPLSAFGVAPIAGMGDETIANFNVPAFTFAGQTWTSLGVVSNGYLVVGGGTGSDVDFVNQVLPDPERPNNVLAPFWTDLNPAGGGAVRITTLTDGTNTWIVVDWGAVKEFSTTSTNSFQVWIRIGAVEDITYAYGAIGGNGDGGFLTVGAENRFGNRGENEYVNGTGTLPANGTGLRVSSTPSGPGQTHTITYTARGARVGPWKNCAEVTANTIFGTAASCIEGSVTNPQ